MAKTYQPMTRSSFLMAYFRSQVKIPHLGKPTGFEKRVWVDHFLAKNEELTVVVVFYCFFCSVLRMGHVAYIIATLCNNINFYKFYIFVVIIIY